MPTTPTSKRIPVAKISATGELLTIYSSARQAGKANFMSGQTVSNHCNSRTKNTLAPDGNHYVWDSKLEYTRKLNQ